MRSGTGAVSRGNGATSKPVERSKNCVGHGDVSGRIIINGAVTLKLRHDFILPIFVSVIQRVLGRSHNMYFSLPVKHFEIRFRVSHAQKTDYARFALTENDAATETVMKTPRGRRRTRDLLLPRLLSGQVEIKTEVA